MASTLTNQTLENPSSLTDNPHTILHLQLPSIHVTPVATVMCEWSLVTESIASTSTSIRVPTRSKRCRILDGRAPSANE